MPPKTKAGVLTKLQGLLALIRNRQLLWFACGAALFQLADALMLPLAVEAIGRGQSQQSSLLASGFDPLWMGSAVTCEISGLSVACLTVELAARACAPSRVAPIFRLGFSARQPAARLSGEQPAPGQQRVHTSDRRSSAPGGRRAVSGPWPAVRGFVAGREVACHGLELLHLVSRGARHDRRSSCLSWRWCFPYGRLRSKARLPSRIVRCGRQHLRRQVPALLSRPVGHFLLRRVAPRRLPGQCARNTNAHRHQEDSSAVQGSPDGREPVVCFRR